MAELKLNFEQLKSNQRHSIAGNYQYIPKLSGLGKEYEIEPISEKDDKTFEDSSSGKFLKYLCSLIYFLFPWLLFKNRVYLLL